MGEVYLANDTQLGRHVAIKFLVPDSNTGDLPQRLLREARAAAALDHPNICSVFEVGTHDNRPFIVMQYVEGDTLASLLRHGALSSSRALDIGSQIASALHAAHSVGIVHRDIKPQNVMLTPGGQVKLLDFGLAKVNPQSSPADQTHSGVDPLTLDGHRLAGTPAYMAPEQITGGDVDGRTDLFALGAVLYECLTGRPAFGGAKPVAQIFGQILRDEPRGPSSLVAGLTPDHDALCRRLMAKTPGDRFDTASDALDAINQVSQSSNQPRLRRLRALMSDKRYGAAVAVVLLALLAGTAWYSRSDDSLSAFEAPAPAQQWYEQGANAVREGSYTKAKRALQQALAIHNRFPLAHARLAEALSELDESGAAKTELLAVHELVPDPNRLERSQRLRLAGINATVIRDFGKAVDAYSELAAISTGQADVRVDLGRALERVGRRDQAMDEYRQALTLGPDSAVAHLRLAVLLGDKGDAAGARAQFMEAQQIYENASNVEGVVETLLARGSWHNQYNRLSEARTDLALASRMAADSNLTHQRVRAMLQLSSLSASEGHFSEAEATAKLAVEEARTAEMDGLAASSLIDFGNVLFVKGRRADAERIFTQAQEIAERHGARRTEARAALSLASVLVSSSRPREAIPLIERSLAFYKEGGYEQNERLALTLLASAYAGTGELERARTTYEQLVRAGREINDASGTAHASERLAGVLMDLGRLPDALEASRETLDINRRVGNQRSLPFNLNREAELLGRLGRLREAEEALRTLQASLDRGDEAYEPRRANITLARANLDMIKLDWQATLTAAETARKSAGAEEESLRILAELTASVARANLAVTRGATAIITSAIARTESQNNPRLLLTARELAVAALAAAGEHEAAHVAAETAIVQAETTPNQESAWRLHAMAASCATQTALKGGMTDSTDHRSAALKHLADLQKTWNAQAFASYIARPDVAALKKRAGI
jgi:tetratricopeptide (TPR) repeat protein